MKSFIRHVLAQRFFYLMLFVVTLLAGYRSFSTLPVDAFPDVTPALVQVFTETDGLAPEEVERYVTYPVEIAMNGLPDVERVRSISNFGLSIVSIYFKDGTDIYFARQIVNERLQHAREDIPPGFGTPELGPISTGLGQVLFYYISDESGQLSLQRQREIQDWLIKFNLQSVPGVVEVLSLGGEVKQFQVSVRPDALLRFGLSIEDVTSAIKANNSNVGAQFIVKNSEQYVVRSIGLAHDIADLNNIVLKNKDGIAVYVRDVADIAVGGEIRQGLATMNGQGEVVAGLVLKLIGTNTTDVISRVKARIQIINSSLPEGVMIVPYYDQSALVERSITTVKNALLQGVGLVALIILLMMGRLAPTLVVALSIPFSIAFAFIAMKFLGLSANLMSLGGIAIAIGLMVDGAIVIVENIDRRMTLRTGSEDKMSLLISAVGEVVRPIGFAILIIIVVFLPLFTLEGVEGKTFRPLAIATALAMFGSLIFALLIAPALSMVFFKFGSETKTQEPKNNAVSDRISNSITRFYAPLVSYFIRHRMQAVGFSAGLVGLGLALIPFIGTEFVPRLNEGDLLVRVTMAPSISLEESRDTVLRFERRLMKEFPEVSRVVSRVGRGEVGAHADPVNNAEVFIALRPESEWAITRAPDELYAAMSHSFENFPGANFNFTQPIAAAVDELITGTKAELAIKLFGPDIDILKNQALKIEKIIRGVAGASDVQTDQVTGSPQLRITIDRAALAPLGLNIDDVQSFVRTAIGGEQAGQLFDGVKRFDIVVRYAKAQRSSAEAIGNQIIQTPTGALVQLSAIAKIDNIVGPRQITRENGQRFISIQVNVRGRDIGSFVAEGQRLISEKIKLPPGYFALWGGQFELQQAANKRLKIVVPITLALIFLLLFVNFNSLKSSILILINIPLALVGGVVALWLSGINISVPASVGFIALFGIALENAMVLVTYLNQLTREGKSIDQASLEGAILRVRPVLMTAFTTALGLIPLLYATGTGSEVQKPLAVVVVGGLISSTVLTLLILPALYKWFAPEIRQPAVEKKSVAAE